MSPSPIPRWMPSADGAPDGTLYHEAERAYGSFAAHENRVLGLNTRELREAGAELATG